VDFYRVDVSREEDVSRAVENVYSKHGRIDVLVNNAGIGFQVGVSRNNHSTSG